MGSNGGSLLKLFSAIAAVVAAALISMAPDFKRYMKIEST
jgi:hypothetical protein